MGIITEATVELYAQPEVRAFATLGFPRFEDGFPVVTRLFELGVVPALVDLTEEEPSDGMPPCVLYMGFEGYAEEVEAQRSRAIREGTAAGGSDLGLGPTERYWRERRHWAERWRDHVGPLRPTDRWRQADWRAADYLHLSLPVSGVLDYKRRSDAIVERHRLAIREAAVWTDPRLFSLLVVDSQGGEAGRQAVLAGAIEELLALAQDMGGGIEYCHGIGAKLAPFMEREWADALLLARRLKHAVDPNGTLNPGKLGLGPGSAALQEEGQGKVVDRNEIVSE